MKTKRILAVLAAVSVFASTLVAAPALAETTVTGVEVPEGATQVYTNACTDTTDWTLSGATVTANAYDYEGSAITITAKEQRATLTLPEAAQLGKNALVTFKFYSTTGNHSYRVGIAYSDATSCYFGGNYQNHLAGGNYMIQPNGNSYVASNNAISVGWHELAAKVDNSGGVTYYIDGSIVCKNDGTTYTTTLADGVTLSSVNADAPGWSYDRTGAITDVKVYSIPVTYIESFTIGGVNAIVDDEAGTITASDVSEIATRATYALSGANATLDIADNSVVTDGQEITYTNGDFTKTYTISLTTTPFVGYEIPDNATLVETVDCSTATGWTLTGAELTEGAYSYNGSAIKADAKNETSSYTFTNALSKNAIVTMKFYTVGPAYSFRAGVKYSDGKVGYVAGRYQNYDYKNKYVMSTRDEMLYGDNTNIMQSVGWHELAAVVDAEGKVTYYIDGELFKKGSTEFYETLPEGVTLTGIGSDTPGWGGGYGGAITDIKVYQVAEPVEEVPTVTVTEFGRFIDEGSNPAVSYTGTFELNSIPVSGVKWTVADKSADLELGEAMNGEGTVVVGLIVEIASTTIDEYNAVPTAECIAAE